MVSVFEKFKRVLRLPISELFKKISDKTVKKIFGGLLVLLYNNLKTAEVLKFDNWSTSMNFYYDNLRVNGIHKLYFENSVYRTIQEANMICEGKINILGIVAEKTNGTYRWNVDYYNKYEWKNKYYRNIKFYNSEYNMDVKYTWELSRFHHLIELGKAYCFTSDKRYFIEFKEELLDWLHNNPYSFSVNWTCAMEVSIRAVNWIGAYFLFEKELKEDPDFLKVFNYSLYEHGKFIINNLEKNPYGASTNHYLANLLGLIVIGYYFRGKDISNRKKRYQPNYWVEYGIKEVEIEILSQTNIDGTNFESSVMYHRLSTEILMLIYRICEINQKKLTDNYKEILIKSCEFIKNITKPNMLAPIIGDSDDGRILILSKSTNYDVRDLRHILAWAGDIFNRDDFLSISYEWNEERYMYTGNYSLFQNNNIFKLNSRKYPAGGYYLLRNERIYLCVKCGDVGTGGLGNHTHNDQLSFELNIDGQDVIIDPGTYIYTGNIEYRNKFRSYKYHNMSISKSSNNIDDNLYHIFAMSQNYKILKIHFSDNTFIGRIKLDDKEYERKIIINSNSVVVKDEVYSNDKTEVLSCNLTFSETVYLEPSVNTILMNNGSYVLIAGKNVVSNICQRDISMRYGKITKSSGIMLKSNVNRLEYTIKI